MNTTTPKSQQAAKLILAAAESMKQNSTVRFSLELVAGGFDPNDVEHSYKLPKGTLSKILYG